MLHEPTGRLWAEVDSDSKEQRWDEGRSELKTPSDVTNIFDDDVGAETKEDACGRNSVIVPFLPANGIERDLTDNDPELPEHDECASNPCRGHLRRVDRDSRVLCTDADTHNEPRSEQSFPRLGKGGTNGGGCETESSDENLTSPAQVVVERINDESATVSVQLVLSRQTEAALWQH